ncbi:Ketosteroid isomerase-related protein [Cnuella takakiae]|uniref:Ketosteroid isomerase-related protein n=1 Tax=Cnuella takakiae TaxID=1302690 RepID=A0A1M4T0Y4_9BACT|nr:nuclear transport factor 2 family protein [Cnuella takakiae]OLY90650.1 hypothetical protein BUE76_01085 [Cnuella takakiae]SHE38030.1 Ketosteroid isomerase-related protein [Cnuella takakiae]
MELVGTNLDVIKTTYKKFIRGDIAGLMEHYLDDVVFHYIGTPLMPLTGNYEGKAGVLRFFQMIPEHLELFLFEPREFYDAGDTIIILGREGARSQKTGKSYEGHFIHIAQLENGKLKRLRLFPDTAGGTSIFSE